MVIPGIGLAQCNTRRVNHCIDNKINVACLGVSGLIGRCNRDGIVAISQITQRNRPGPVRGRRDRLGLNRITALIQHGHH